MSDHLGEEIVGRWTQGLLEGIARLEAAARPTEGADRPPARDLWRAALDLEHLLLCDLLTAAEEETVLRELPAERVRAAQEIFRPLETRIENSFAALTLQGGREAVLRRESISENYLVRYERLARGEADMAGIRSSDRALFIGSGPFPITAIEYHRQTGCSVDCADFVPEAVATSREVVRALGLDSHLRCLETRGEHLPLGGYSVILVGVLAQPKRAILENLCATAPDGCRVIARTTFGLRRLIYQPAQIEEERYPALRRAAVNVARGDQTLSAFLYLRDDRPPLEIR